uniref:Membrane protein At3g27390 family n=1 Tax=Cajanus cajan TaxID=3821 RepID=A0A151RN61_CAJCA|nr:putative membrane protein At3g27390 family [Cajanus cajan]
MEPPTGFYAIWSFVLFLPFFIGLWLLGHLKGAIFCPLVCLIMTIGNSAIIYSLWPIHCIWTYYCVVRSEKLGPSLKFVTCTFLLPLVLISWPVVGIVGSVIGGAAYGFFAPIFATFEAVEGGKENKLLHCFIDGTWTTILKTFDIVKDVKNECYDTYFSVMDDLLQPKLPDDKYYEISFLTNLAKRVKPILFFFLLHFYLSVFYVFSCMLWSMLDLTRVSSNTLLESLMSELHWLRYFPAAIVAAVLGIIVDMPAISAVAICKGPYMLFKGWNRLFHDLIGREGPFLETICVPFAGLAIILWPLAVVGAILASVLASFFLGAYAGLVAYQESSFLFGLGYIVAAVSLYDEYSNDILDLKEGSCFPRPRYRKNAESELKSLSKTPSRTNSLSKTKSLTKTLSGAISLKNNMAEFKAVELLNGLFKECHQLGESLITEGLIKYEDIQEAKSNKGGRVIRIGLPAYCLLKALLRSVKADSTGILISDDTELTTTNRPQEQFFEWFLNPLLIIKEQIKAENLSVSEEDYLGKLVLFNGDSNRVKNSLIVPGPESDRKRAELDALARRLQGITKFITRFPTYKRQFDLILNTLSDDLAEKHGASKIIRSKSAFPRILSLKSFKGKTSNNSGQESEHTIDLETSS